MKHTAILIISAAASCLLMTNSCNNVSELPPLNEGYATEYILPDPVDLTAEDRAYLEELENEYSNAISGTN